MNKSLKEQTRKKNLRK